MSSRLALALFAAAALVSTPLSAAELHAYTPKAFDAAQAAGKPILVEVHAPWCPTCKAQQSVLEILGGAGEIRLAAGVPRRFR